MQTPLELDQYLHTHIPLAQFMQLRTQSIGETELLLHAPLAPNLNVHGTVFGGSGAAICLIAAWSLLFLRMQKNGLSDTLVVRRQNMSYNSPIAGDFFIRARFPGAADGWQLFCNTLEQTGKSRINIQAQLEYQGAIAAELEGEFIALRSASMHSAP